MVDKLVIFPVKMSSELKAAALETAARRGESLAAVLRAATERYVARHKEKP